MKALWAVLFLAVAAAACQKEISLSGTAATPPVRCTGCNYLPVCDSMPLAYVDSSAAGIDTLRSVVLLLGDTSVNGKKFHRVSPFAAFRQGLLYRCEGGDYRVVQPVPALGVNVDSLLQLIGLPGGSVTFPSHVQTTILKTGVAAGATWSDTVLQFSPFPFVTATVTLDYTIKEKSVQRTVLGKTYRNVLHVSSEPAVAVPLVPPSPLGILVDAYYADGAGLIESRTTGNGVVQSLLRRVP